MAEACRVSLLSIDPWQGPSEGFRPFNYSIRKIQASLTLVEGLDVKVHDFLTSDVDRIEVEIEASDPDLIGASVYVWSLPAFHELARRLKRTRPDRMIVFGGPSARPAMLSQAPFRDALGFVDVLVIGEGEEIIRDLARIARDKRPRHELRRVQGIALADGASWFVTGPRTRVMDLDALPSPYQLGLVPEGRTAHLESFRGCPFSCSFCEWGVLGSASPIFSTEYLVREMEAMRRVRSNGAFSVDAALNLNARSFRNLKAACERTGVFSEIPFHCELYPSHFNDEHVELLSGMRDPEVAIGVQSFDPEVAKGVERPFDPARFDGIFQQVADVAVPTLLIILGLPGDNLASFRRTLDRCLSYGASVHVFHCLVLPDALMTRAPAGFQMDYDPVTLAMRSCTGWSADDFRAAWGYLAERIAQDGGECIPYYWCQVRPPKRTPSYPPMPQRRLAAAGQAR